MREISDKYGGDPFLFEFFGEIFRWMPVAHVVEGKILVVHGGISASPTLTLEDIQNVKWVFTLSLILPSCKNVKRRSCSFNSDFLDVSCLKPLM